MIFIDCKSLEARFLFQVNIRRQNLEEFVSVSVTESLLRVCGVGLWCVDKQVNIGCSFLVNLKFKKRYLGFVFLYRVWWKRFVCPS